MTFKEPPHEEIIIRMGESVHRPGFCRRCIQEAGEVLVAANDFIEDRDIGVGHRIGQIRKITEEVLCAIHKRELFREAFGLPDHSIRDINSHCFAGAPGEKGEMNRSDPATDIEHPGSLN